MSYIHVAIPVNLTSIQQQINAFTNMSTSHSNELHFTRVINELATFAQKDVIGFTNRLQMLDHVLPVDNKHNCNKCFLDLILMEVCSNQLHLLKVEHGQCNLH